MMYLGGITRKMIYLFKSINLIGDGLYISPAWREWLIRNVTVGDVVLMHTLNDHITPLYYGMISDLIDEFKLHYSTVADPEDDTIDWGGVPDFKHTFDVSEAFKVSDQKQQHLAQSYADILGVELPGAFPGCVKPIYMPKLCQPGTEEYAMVQQLHGCILISAFSNSCSSRDAHRKLPPNKMLPWPKWIPMMDTLRERYPNTPIRFLGAATDMIPNGYASKIVEPGEYLTGIPLNRLALIMKNAKLLVTIDNGMSHLAASQETPTFLMYPRCLGLHYIVPVGNPKLLGVEHMDPLSVSPLRLKRALECALVKLEA